MIGSFRQSMTWLHTWAGLVFCWILYFMFVTGTLGYFDTEIDHWMQPEVSETAELSAETRTATALAYLEEHGQGAEQWVVTPGGNRDERHVRVFYRMPAGEEGEEVVSENVRLSASTGQPLDDAARKTHGGQLLYRMHYVLHYLDRDIAFRLVGIMTLFMFVGIISGIIAHKKIFKDFFTFRPNKGQRSWLDMHNLLSVSSLPFQLMITYSGLIFVTVLWMPLIPFASVGFDSQKAAELVEVFNLNVEAAGTPAPLADVNAIVRDAE
ncbi:MAG: PepSY-associated TM helix domain-containing protein, partial [Pseudomonadota bacterium]